MKLSRQFFIILFLYTLTSSAQNAVIKGIIKVDNQPTSFVNVHLLYTNKGTVTDEFGKFGLENLAIGNYTLQVSFLGYEPIKDTIKVTSANQTIELNFNLNQKRFDLNELVITGTKTFKRQTDSPVIVNVITSKTLDNVQACTLAEGLKFQSGLRVETDCQTCNYTQLRINGLAGGYSQVLVNNRPIFSSLTSLYGLEQMPVNMIDRIEVIRGGGSSLYGSSAIGGTVNVITKVPTKNSCEANYVYQNINNQASDHQFNGYATALSKSKNAGLSLFLSTRNREFYDHNGDNFSEIPQIKNYSFGFNTFFNPIENHKINIHLSNLNEYRFGGEMVEETAYLTQQAEERTTQLWLGNVDYQIDFRNNKTSLITYLAGQITNREHYTGIYPDDEPEISEHLANPPYGNSNATTKQIGLQLNHTLNSIISGTNTFTFGSEYILDDIIDEIESYDYQVDQTTNNLGMFLQSDWTIVPSLTLLTGVRMDYHNLLDNLIFSPRASLLYKVKNNTQFRLSYGSGFRAPQAFDTDLHIAFAGGGVSRVSLSPNLINERSHSINASVNYDKATEKFIAGFTLEGFYTRLKDAFFLHPTGQDDSGYTFEKQNGPGATVQGITVELRGNYNRIIQIETGFTFQTSHHNQPIQYFLESEGIREFIRTPNDYGFAILTFTPLESLNINLNYNYTGRMKVPHFAGAPNQLADEIITSPSFSELGFKFGYNLKAPKLYSQIELFAGLKNIFNAYQTQFDVGKNRDSNFVFGPSAPRIIFIGLKIRSLM